MDFNIVFEHEGNFYTIKQEKYEMTETYLERVRFILSKIENITNEQDYDELIKQSLIMINIKQFNCKY